MHIALLYALSCAQVGAIKEAASNCDMSTELASKGVSVRVLAELAGHSSIQTTQRYINVNPQQMSFFSYPALYDAEHP